MRGQPMPPGTHPWTRQESEPWLTPMAPRIDTGELIRRINRLLHKPGFLLPRFRAPRELKTKVKG